MMTMLILWDGNITLFSIILKDGQESLYKHAIRNKLLHIHTIFLLNLVQFSSKWVTRSIRKTNSLSLKQKKLL